MFIQQIFTQKNFHTKIFSHRQITESLRLSFVDLRWAQLYVSLVTNILYLTKPKTFMMTSITFVLFCVPTFQLKSGQVWAIHRMAEMLLNKDLRSLDLATVPMMFRLSVLLKEGNFCEAGVCWMRTLPDLLWWGILAVYHTWPIFILVPALVTSLCRYLTWAEHYRWVKVDRITAEWITSKILKNSLFFLAPQVLL